MPNFEELMERAKARLDLKRARMASYNKLVGMGRYVICECGQSYGNEYIPMDKYETINNCPFCGEKLLF